MNFYIFAISSVSVRLFSLVFGVIKNSLKTLSAEALTDNSLGISSLSGSFGRGSQVASVARTSFELKRQESPFPLAHTYRAASALAKLYFQTNKIASPLLRNWLAILLPIFPQQRLDIQL